MTQQATVPIRTLEFEYEDRFGWIVRNVANALGNERADEAVRKGSRVVVTEDGRALPMPHAPHEVIKSLGGGRYSHWGDCVRFSTTDNSNPATNGRVYGLDTGTTRVELRPAQVGPDWAAEVERRLSARRSQVSDVDAWCRHTQGFAWALNLPVMAQRGYLPLPPQHADIDIREDGHRLRPAACVDQVVREGAGLYIREGDRVCFAARDGSNPKLNGRRYELTAGSRSVVIPPSPVAAILGVGQAAPAAGLDALIRRAVAAGEGIGLDLPHGLDYYHFLAGLMQSCGFARMLEVGTERGYSASACAIGMGDTIACLVTCDLAARAPILNRHQRVHRVVGDVMAPGNMRRVLELFDHRPIDVLFVDSGHDYPTTAAHMGTFAAFLRPRLILVDDIVLNEDMARFWRDVRLLYGPRAVNACDVDPRVRSAECGFGMVVLDDRLIAAPCR